ncbi:hypothetical protein QMK17_17440 [Rhodococcus sp. G-MC3]|uniref:hypothetical protein n=1 Tax=Rhodococcus sp. G-MC3 TaxID=3046209 RepID=UPI0024BA940B|nr:hypothetical protein [Rhodococcus sp. G-MC3]MDJ0395111.1 hypothetical protein [Rhodococcus sp. G-MC3]
MVWYVSYGSNLLAERFHTYLTGSDATSPFGAHPPAPSAVLPTEERWLWLDHALYFAGVSQRWTGSAAFVSHERGSGESVAHAYLIDRSQFTHLVAVENAVEAVEQVSPESVSIGSYAVLDIDRGGEAFRGKYDAMLRLPDIDDVPAVTFTSSTMRERGGPAEMYLETIRRGLESSPFDLDVDVYLADAIARSSTISMPWNGHTARRV